MNRMRSAITGDMRAARVIFAAPEAATELRLQGR
jgi:hypothetical protein